MGFTSADDLINQISVNGKVGRFDSYKLLAPAAVAGNWTDLTVLTGNPIADTYDGTSLTWVATDESSKGAIPHGGNVSSATKHVLSAGGTVFAAAGAPWVLMCVDQLGYVPITGGDVTSTSARTITMTALGAGARYPYGEGCRAYFSTEIAPTAGGPNMGTFTYVNSNSGSPATNTCPVTVGMMATPVAGAMPHSGNAATRFSPFLPMAAGDTGISDFVNFTWSGGTAYTGSGAMVLHLVKPLFTIPIPANGIWVERDFVNQLPSLPRIKDGAYLKWLLFSTGATTTNSPFNAYIEYGWGG